MPLTAVNNFDPGDIASIGSAVVALAALALSFWTTRIGLKHQRSLAHNERIWQRKAELYADLLAFLTERYKIFETELARVDREPLEEREAREAREMEKSWTIYAPYRHKRFGVANIFEMPDLLAARLQLFASEGIKSTVNTYVSNCLAYELRLRRLEPELKKRVKAAYAKLPQQNAHNDPLAWEQVPELQAVVEAWAKEVTGLIKDFERDEKWLRESVIEQVHMEISRSP